MRFLITIPLALMIVSPSCRSHFETGTIEITNPQGQRTLSSKFHNGQLGKIGQGTIFRATLDDGSTVMIENKQATETEEKK